MGCAPSAPEAYHAPSELLYPRPTRHLSLGRLQPVNSTDLPLVGIGSASMVGTGAHGSLQVELLQPLPQVPQPSPPQASPLQQLALPRPPPPRPPPSQPRLNQDAFAADARLGLFAVIDGHGPAGHRISARLAEELVGQVASELVPPPPVSHAVAAAHTLAPHVAPELAIRRAFLAQSVALLRTGPTLDCSLSGATCAALLLDGPRAITAHVGDVRIVAAMQRSPRDRPRAEDWTTDHCPTVPDEAKRLAAFHARVLPWANDWRSGQRPPVPRVWLPDRPEPGLAVTRCFGATAAADVGVISEPTVRVWPLTRDLRFLILASDGLWQYVSSQEAVDIVARVLNSQELTVHDAAYALVLEAAGRCVKDSPSCDDITVVILLMDSASLPWR